ncbi:LURP-one-related/scramblase family protein [uncultured Allofournierella sp.]|uniref:LURP-one-related/scramblase family protein n=1 Tax=uncultured Allofournierella sp. TaxID=1940258 RepID=UPI003752E1EC
MKLLFKQRLFSWFDSYDIYNEYGEAVFRVEGKVSWGHRLEISNAQGQVLGTVQQKFLAFLPQFFLLDENGQEIGLLRKEFTLFKPRFQLDCNGWNIQGNWLGWDYQITDPAGRCVMQASKQLLNWTDTYTMDIQNEQDALLCVMVVLAIDAANCTEGN